MSRIEPLNLPYPADVQADFDRIMPPGAPPRVLFRAIAKSGRAWTKFRAASLLDRGPLSLREREIVINRTCALAGCEYEWGVHVAVFAAPARLTEEQVKATVLGPCDAPCWLESEQALIAAVDALHYRATLSDQEFAELAAHFDGERILEIMQLCGFYRTVAYIANGLDLPREPTAARFPGHEPET